MSEKSVRMDPTDTAVAAILALDLTAYAKGGNDYVAIATALEPLVEAAPPLREWDEDEEWTAAEEAVAAARSIVEWAGIGSRDGTWQRCRYEIDRLLKTQRAHKCDIIRDRVGAFAGYQIQVRCGYTGRALISVFPERVCVETSFPLFELDPDSSRGDVGIAIQAWRQGYERGQREGAERIRKGMRELLEIEAP